MHSTNNDYDYFADQISKSSNVRTPLRNVENFDDENAHLFGQTSASSNWRSPLRNDQEFDGEFDRQSIYQIESEDDQEQKTPGRKRYQKARQIILEKFERRPLKGKHSDLFQELFDTGNPSEFIGCKKCNFIIQKKNRSSIIRHKKIHLCPPIMELEKKFKDSLILPAMKGKSFQFVNSAEFVNIIEAFAELKVKYTEMGVDVNAKNLIPSNRTIGRQIRALWSQEEVKKELRNLTEMLIADGSISFDFGKNVRDYFVITGHVFDENFNLRAFVLNFTEWKEEKTRQKIRTFLQGLSL